MTIAAAELLANNNIDSVTRVILHGVEALDSFGARDWNLRVVAVSTCAILSLMRIFFNKKYNIDWYALSHNFVTGVGSVAAVYLDFFSAQPLTGTAEPLRSCLCGGPLTSLHRILPAITMGYGVLDLIEGLHLGPDFAAHGVATFSIMTFFVESELPQVVVPFLMMEVSSIFLCVVRADFWSDTMAMTVQALFALNFFIFRIIVTPFIWFRLIHMMYEHSGDELYQSCFNPYVLPVSIGVGLFFHSLNAFWFYKIVRKAKRKLSGKEKVRANNDLREKEGEMEDSQRKEEEDKENMSVRANTTGTTAVNGVRERKASKMNEKKDK